MEIKLNKDFLDLDGKVMNNSRECCIQKSDGSLALSEGKYVTVMVPTPGDRVKLKQVCIKALLADIPDDQTDPYEKYKLFKRFHETRGKIIEIESAEITLLKDLIKETEGIFIMGQAYDMLEGK